MYNTQSINTRLKNASKELGIENVERTRVILCLERVIARLMHDTYLSRHLIFGGGFILYKETNSERFTRDVDAIISGIEKEKLISKVNEIIKVDLNDGFWFGNAIIEELKTESGYGGVRFKIQYKAGLPLPSEDEYKRLKRVHLDISIGVDLEQYAKHTELKPTLDIYDSIDCLVFPIEFICSEKIHCLLERKDLNTRGKDIYDLGRLLPQTDIQILLEAIRTTFSNRNYSAHSIIEEFESIDTSNLKEGFNKSLFKNKDLEFDKCWDAIHLAIGKLSELLA